MKHMNLIRGCFIPPGDKSISQRAVLLASIADGRSRIRGFLKSQDCIGTKNCMHQLGIRFEEKEDALFVSGRGLYGLQMPEKTLDCQNSATAMRLMSGILSAQRFDSVLSGDESLRKRPMNRVIEPLLQMGAQIRSHEESGMAPLSIFGRSLRGAQYRSPLSSAQVKSAFLLASLYADGESSFEEASPSRNHTEIMLAQMGANLYEEDQKLRISPAEALSPIDLTVPGDLSSAAYFIAAALLLPGSELLIKDVGLNPTRSGIISAFREMGAQMEILRLDTLQGEVRGDLLVRGSALKGICVEGRRIPSMIDELPLLAAVAACAEGETIIRDAQELRVKESNRIRAMTNGLSSMGVDVQETEDGMIIRGKTRLLPAKILSYNDHRIAMSFFVLSLLTEGGLQIEGVECIAVSCPSFLRDLKSLVR